jgi:hypothetical protein
MGAFVSSAITPGLEVWLCEEKVCSGRMPFGHRALITHQIPPFNFRRECEHGAKSRC